VCLTHERETGSSRTGFDDVEWFGERTSYDRFPRMLIHKFSQIMFSVIQRVSKLSRLLTIARLDHRLPGPEQKDSESPGICLAYSRSNTSAPALQF